MEGMLLKAFGTATALLENKKIVYLITCIVIEAYQEKLSNNNQASVLSKQDYSHFQQVYKIK